MANNLVSIITQIFGAQMVARVAASLGISPALAQTLANAAIPTILASLGSLAASPGGAQKIADQIQSQDSNILGSLVNSLGSGNQASFLNSGTGMLSSLLGGGATSSIAGALAKFTGAEPAQAQSMLGVVTPATFGALAQQDPAIWSSADGIANLFRREQPAISAALPAGISTALGASGLLSNLADFGAAAGSAVGGIDHAASTVSRAATEIGDGASRLGSGASEAVTSTAAAVERGAETAAAGIPGWLKILVPVALLGALVWFMMPAPKPAPAPTTPSSPAAPPPATQTQPPIAAPSTAQRAAAELAEFAQKTNATVAAIGNSLAGITNADQARAAQPQLEQTANDLNVLAGNFAKLPTEARSALAAPMQATLGALSSQITRVLAVPGVADILKPAIDRITAATAAFKA